MADQDMHDIGVAFLALYLSCLGAVFLYQAILALWGIRVHQGGQKSSRMRFAVLIPAHNEEMFIDGIIESLRKVNYPVEQLHVLFIADHCSDDTPRKITSAGFSCLDRQTGERGKTPALLEGINLVNRRLADKVDAITFFDADNIIHPDFFAYTSSRLEAGVSIVQGNVGIHNRYDSLFTRLNYINMAVIGRLKELARSQAGLTCQLRGHGMTFRKDVLDKMGWQASSLVEDREMLVRLVLKGYRVVWENAACVDSVYPTSTKSAAAQRRRWAGGKSALLRPSVKALCGKWIRDRDWIAFDLMVDFLMPSHAVQLSLVFLGMAGTVWLSGIDSWLSLSALMLLLFYYLYFLAGSLLSGVPFHVFLNFLMAPLYILWRTWIYLTSLKGATKWR